MNECCKIIRKAQLSTISRIAYNFCPQCGKRLAPEKYVRYITDEMLDELRKGTVYSAVLEKSSRIPFFKQKIIITIPEEE